MKQKRLVGHRHLTGPAHSGSILPVANTHISTETPMKTLRFVVGAVLFVALFATASMAQANRTFVSGAGLDTNPCSLTQPCRTFGQAISVTNAGGEVVVLTSAGYGAFSINKAITVEAPAGVYAGITVTSGDGIDVNAGSMDTVILRGLTVNNQGGSGSGIVFNSGGTVQIESCVVNGFSSNSGGTGITITCPGNSLVKDTTVRGNFFGIYVVANVSTATVAMDHVHVDGNAFGLKVVSTGPMINAAIRNSSASGNSNIGIEVVANAGSATLTVESCLITDNTNDGISVSGLNTGTATASISNCTITGNLAGFDQEPGGVINSRVNNTITGNGTNSGSLTTLPAQ
jgi:hypothetical protein